MRIFITAAGMVGCHTAYQLAQGGDEVVLFDLAPRDDYIKRVVQADVDVIRGDIGELPGLVDAIHKSRPEVVIHTAALIGVAAQQVPYRGYQVNVNGTINVAEAVRLAGVRRLLHSSSLAVNDRAWAQQAPITEEFPSSGNDNIYGASKLAAEHLLRAYSIHYGFELGILRFAGVYGYGHFAGGSGVGRAMFNLVKAALEGRRGTIDAGIPDSSEMIYAKDVARAVAAATYASRLPHHTYNIGTGELVTPDSILDALRRVVPGAAADRPTDAAGGKQTRHQPFDLARSRDELGFAPEYNLDAGIRDLVNEIQADRKANGQ